MQTTFKFFVPCFFLLTLFLLTGCGSKDKAAGGTAIPELTAAERAEADKMLAEYGKDVMVYFLIYAPEDQEYIIRHFKYFLSQGADVNGTGRARGDGGGETALHLVAAQGRSNSSNSSSPMEPMSMPKTMEE